MRVVIPPKDFEDYEWDEDFKLVMFCLEFTRLYFSQEKVDGWAQEKLEEWGYKDKDEVYGRLWCNFKYFKGHAFDKKFKIVESHTTYPYCKQEISFAEIKPGRVIDTLTKAVEKGITI